MRFMVLGCLVSALAACGDASPSSPSDSSSLTLTATISQPVLQPGDIATLTFRLRNTGTAPRSLQFPSSCQLMPYIATPSETLVYPAGGSWVCATVLTTLTLPPGEAKVETLLVTLRPSELSSVYGLPAGDYVAYARVEGSSLALQSEKVAFTVK